MKTAKKIYIKNIEKFDFLLELESNIKGESITSLIEEHIFNDILKTENSRIYVDEFLKHGMNKTLEKLFLNISEQNDPACKTSLKKLFEFALKEKDYSITRTYNYITINEIMDVFLELSVRIKKFLDNFLLAHKDDLTSNLKYKNYKKIYEDMLDFYENANREDGTYIENNIWMFFARSWEVIWNGSEIYLILSKLESMMSDYNNDDLISWEFIEVLNMF